MPNDLPATRNNTHATSATRLSSRDKDVLSYKVPLRNKLAYFFARRKLLKFTGIIVLVAALCYGFIWVALQFQSIAPIFPAFSDASFAGLFGALFGSVLGAIISAGVSLYLHSQQLQADASIAKKRDIYEPLYNALLQLISGMNDYPYWRGIITDPDAAMTAYTPRFTEWRSIKNDSRFIRVPFWIVKMLDRYIEDIGIYEKMVDVASEEVANTTVKFLSDNNIEYPVVSGEGDLILRDIIIKDRSGFGLHSVSSHLKEKGLEDEKINSLMADITIDCRKLSSFVNLIDFYKISIEYRAQWILREMDKIVRYINIRFENHGDLV